MEIEKGPLTSKLDWLLSDRLAYVRESYGNAEMPKLEQLIIKNSFCRACIEITRERKHAEFNSVQQRHAYYDFMSYAFEFTWLPHEKAKQIKFFHAAAAVTTWSAIGATESLATTIPVVKEALPSQDALNLLRDINSILFKENMYVLFCLLFTKELKVPFQFVSNSPCVIHPQEVSCFEFDVQMVKFEQIHLSAYLTNNSQKFTKKVIGEINDTLNPNVVIGTVKPPIIADIAINMAKEALKLSDLDFMDYRHRTAIGFASIHIFHKKKHDYRNFLKTIFYI